MENRSEPLIEIWISSGVVSAGTATLLTRLSTDDDQSDESALAVPGIEANPAATRPGRAQHLAISAGR